MPTRPQRPCRKPGCPKLTDSGWCEDHARARPDGQKPWAGTTGSAHSRGYGANWRRLRQMVLNRDPLCRICGRAASVTVDHIKPKAELGEDTLENLQGLCAACHARKSAREGVAARGRVS